MESAKEIRSKQISQLVEGLSKRKNLTVYSVEGRRESDIVGFTVWGERQSVLKLPIMLIELLYGEDIEIIQNGRRGMDYVLNFVITEKLSLQSISQLERRAKLINRLDRQLPDDLDFVVPPLAVDSDQQSDGQSS